LEGWCSTNELHLRDTMIILVKAANYVKENISNFRYQNSIFPLVNLSSKWGRFYGNRFKDLIIKHRYHNNRKRNYHNNNLKNTKIQHRKFVVSSENEHKFFTYNIMHMCLREHTNYLLGMLCPYFLLGVKTKTCLPCLLNGGFNG